jgi:hypothetical protein
MTSLVTFVLLCNRPNARRRERCSHGARQSGSRRIFAFQWKTVALSRRQQVSSAIARSLRLAPMSANVRHSHISQM